MPNATTSGCSAELLVGPRGAGHAAAGLHLVEDEQRVVRAAQLLHRLQELRAHVVVAALALDGLGDEAGDVVRVRRERGLGLRQRASLGLGDGGHGRVVQREVDGGHVDARPVELREEVGLDRVGVGQRERVAAAAVERLAQVQHLRAEPAGRPCAALWRRFQSNAVFSAFSTASAPPSTKNRCGSAGSPSTARERLDELARSYVV